MYSKIYTIVIIIEILLYLALLFHLRRLHYASHINIDPMMIKESVNSIYRTSIALMIIVYGLFISKFFMKSKEGKTHHQHYCGIMYISLALLFVFHSSIMSLKTKLDNQQSMPIEYIQEKIQFSENLGYCLVFFVIISKIIAMYSKHYHKE